MTLTKLFVLPLFTEYPYDMLTSINQAISTLSSSLTFCTALYAASLVVNVTKAYPRFVPVIGSIISRKSHIVPHCSNKGISSSSYMSLGIFPQNTSHPDPGVLPSQPGGGPPYFLCPANKHEAFQ